jgi:hypothetical protein
MGNKSEVGDHRSVDSCSKFKVQSLKLELKMKGCYRLPIPFTVYRSPFTIYDLNDFNGFNDL